MESFSGRIISEVEFKEGVSSKGFAYKFIKFNIEVSEEKGVNIYVVMVWGRQVDSFKKKKIKKDDFIVVEGLLETNSWINRGKLIEEQQIKSKNITKLNKILKNDYNEKILEFEENVLSYKIDDFFYNLIKSEDSQLVCNYFDRHFLELNKKEILFLLVNSIKQNNVLYFSLIHRIKDLDDNIHSLIQEYLLLYNRKRMFVVYNSIFKNNVVSVWHHKENFTMPKFRKEIFLSYDFLMDSEVYFEVKNNLINLKYEDMILRYYLGDKFDLLCKEVYSLLNKEYFLYYSTCKWFAFIRELKMNNSKIKELFCLIFDKNKIDVLVKIIPLLNTFNKQQKNEFLNSLMRYVKNKKEFIEIEDLSRLYNLLRDEAGFNNEQLLPEVFSIKAIHDLYSSLYTKYKRNGPNQSINPGKQYSELESIIDNNTFGENCSINIAYDSYTIYSWGEKLRNCIASYCYRYIQGTCLLLGVSVNDNLVANIEISNKQIRQFYGKNNSPVDKKLYKETVEFLKSKKIIN